MEIDNTVHDRAAEWLARLHADGPADWNDPQLSKWLEDSADNRLAFAEASAYWFAAEERSLDSVDDLMVVQPPVRNFWRQLPAWSGSVIALTLVVWLGAPFVDSLVQQISHDYHAPDGQLRRHTMTDGSVITLAGGTSIDIEFSTDRRQVTMYEGEAFFDVSADPDRPFSVNFGAGDLVVLGTHFGLIVGSNEALVGVVQGRVDVGHTGFSQRRILNDHELVAISDRGINADSRRPSELFAWTEGQLVFDQQTLSKILQRMDHFLDGRIVLLRKAGAERRFSLVVSLGNASQALDTLAEQAGLEKVELAGMTFLY